MRIGKSLGDVSDETLRFYRQIGVETVELPRQFHTTVHPSRPHVPPAQRGPAGPLPPLWEVDELRRMRDRAASFGLEATTTALPLSGNILLGLPEREQDLEQLREAIRRAGQAGLRVLNYSFTALRASEGYYALPGAGRGGADLRGFDAARVRDLPPLASVGTHSRAAMWERLEHFLRAVVPAAAAASIQLALHPNDPPVLVFRGVAQPVCSLAALERVLDAVDSPANALYLDTGVLTELGEDAPAAIRRFGRRGRIGAVHFRNVHVERPGECYVETLLDEGDGNMAACMAALAEVGYTGSIDPDHTPGLVADTVDTHKGWAFAIGQLVGLRAAVAA